MAIHHRVSRKPEYFLRHKNITYYKKPIYRWRVEPLFVEKAKKMHTLILRGISDEDRLFRSFVTLTIPSGGFFSVISNLLFKPNCYSNKGVWRKKSDEENVLVAEIAAITSNDQNCCCKKKIKNMI